LSIWFRERCRRKRKSIPISISYLKTTRIIWTIIWTDAATAERGTGRVRLIFNKEA
jgi:hypothetical protein